MWILALAAVGVLGLLAASSSTTPYTAPPTVVTIVADLEPGPAEAEPGPGPGPGPTPQARPPGGPVRPGGQRPGAQVLEPGDVPFMQWELERLKDSRGPRRFEDRDDVLGGLAALQGRDRQLAERLSTGSANIVRVAEGPPGADWLTARIFVAPITAGGTFDSPHGVLTYRGRIGAGATVVRPTHLVQLKDTPAGGYNLGPHPELVILEGLENTRAYLILSAGRGDGAVYRATGELRLYYL